MESTKSRGGKRAGAGRKTGTGMYGEPTVALRVPASLVERVRAFIAGIDNGEPTCPLISLPKRKPFAVVRRTQ